MIFLHFVIHVILAKLNEQVTRARDVKRLLFMSQLILRYIITIIIEKYDKCKFSRYYKNNMNQL